MLKKIKTVFEKAFNTNTGYFIDRVIYNYNQKTEVGYILCRSFTMFGIQGYDRLGIFVDEEEAVRSLGIYQSIYPAN